MIYGCIVSYVADQLFLVWGSKKYVQLNYAKLMQFTGERWIITDP